MELLIKPIDVWLFRDGRPFAAGEDHEATTIFPPTPFTLQGAIRTKVLTDRGVDLTEFARKKQPDSEVGFGDNFGALKLFGPIVARKGQNGKWERLVPTPADLVKIDNDFVPLKPKQLPFKTNLPDGLQ
ncbi:MAG: type III-B CRISPR module-associated Cmr3 family protein, partial [Armatimonadota bacterium]